MQDLPEHLWHDSFRYYVKEDPNRRGGPNLRLIRLDPSRPSLTVTGYIFNKFVHPFEDRFITVREAARLQGLPDNLIFKNTLTSTQMQVGNAVPVPLAKAVFESLLGFADQHGFKKPLQALSLFSGAGGMDIGAELASYNNLRIEVRLIIEKWKDACDTLRGYFLDKVRVLEADIREIADSISEWRNTTGLQNGPDILFGGPPCQSFSQAGKQRGVEDDRGKLIFEFLRFVEELQPAFFVMENVPNLKGINGGKLYKDILIRMESLGYNVASGILLAADYGAPQLRRRILFVGCRKNLGWIDLPTPTHSEFPNFFQKPYVTVGEAFAGLPPAEFNGG